MNEDPPNSEGTGFRVPTSLIDLIGRAAISAVFPQKPSELELLRTRLLELQLAKEVIGTTVAYQSVQPSEIWGEWPGDWVWIGSRGSGKTAGAVAAAQLQSSSVRWCAVDWSPQHAAMVGAESVPWSRVKDLRDAVVVVDETRLRLPRGTKPDEAMFELLALGRQRGLRVHWTTQSTASVPRDVLRMGPTLCFRRSSLIADKYGRQELEREIASARIVREAVGDTPGRVVGCSDAGWWVTELSLPVGWTDDVSKLWR